MQSLVGNRKSFETHPTKEKSNVCTTSRSTEGKNLWMRETISQHVDFKFEKSEIEKFLIRRELNPIERVWAQLKRYTRAHCNYSIQSLRKNIPDAYDSVTLENILNHYRKVRHHMFCYLEGMVPGKELDDTLKRYKTAVKSHRSEQITSNRLLLAQC